MPGALLQVMDPTNPRWDTSEVRFRRQKLFWAVVASSVAAVAASTMLVVSCLGSGHAQRDVSETRFVETAAPAPTTTIVINPVTQPAAPLATADSTGGPNERLGTTNVTSAPISVQDAPTPPPVTAVVQPGTGAMVVPQQAVPRQSAPPARQPVDTSSGLSLPQRPVAPAAGAAATPSAPSLSPTTSPQANSTQAAPSPTTGAGAFVTDSPPWAGSAFQSNPEAGAGAFPPAQ